jgi:uncharacterized protein
MRTRKPLVFAIGAVGVLYLGFLVALFLSERSLIFPGARNQAAMSPPSAPGLEAWRLETTAGDIETLYLAAQTHAGASPAVIFAHGNGELTDYWIHSLDGFRARGIAVLLVEYPGYGRSTGSPSEASIRVAMDAAYDRLASDPRVDRARILGFGQSLGGGAVCLLSLDRPLRAIILESTFPSLAIFTSRYAAPSFLLRDRFDNLSAVRRFAGPLLVIHGRQDRLIPWPEGRRLALASPRATFRLYECGHGCWDPDRLPFWRDADPFLADAGIVERAAAP